MTQESNQSLIALIDGIQSVRGKDDFLVYQECEQAKKAINQKNSSNMERVAKAIYHTRFGEWMAWRDWNKISAKSREQWERYAKAAIESMGLV